MKNFIVKILSLVCLLSLCFVFASCSDKTEYDKLREEGNVISVYYNSNCVKTGDGFFQDPEVTIIDMFNPADFTSDANGKIHIKLLDPLSSKRPGTEMTISKEGMSLIGWYKTRQTKTVTVGGVDYLEDANGDLVEKSESDNRYYVKHKKTADGYTAVAEGKETESEPAYTYSDRWDFDNDTLEYDLSSGKVNYDFYAAWVPYYTFEFYFNKNGEWVKQSEIQFDYVSANSGIDRFDDLDEVRLPAWNVDSDGKKTGELEYKFKLKAEERQFPKLDGTTFAAAYLDEACTQKCDEVIKHTGSLEYKTGTAIDPVQKIYVTTTPGEDYYIDTAEQLVKYAKLGGIYHIKKDLTFTDALKWPAIFTTGNFSGKMYSEGGNVVTVTGVSVLNEGNASGGIFGNLSKSAEIKNIDFKDVLVKFDVKGTALRGNNGNFALFAGLIRSGAKIENVSVNGTLSIGATCLIKTGDDGNSSVNVFANCEKDDYTLVSGLKKGEVVFKVVGEEYNGNYLYLINTDTIKIGDNYELTFDKYNKASSTSLPEYTKIIAPKA